MYCVYNHAGHNFTDIRCYQQFSTIMYTFKDEIGVNRNYTYSGENDPVAEKKNCTVKDLIIYIFIPYHS